MVSSQLHCSTTLRTGLRQDITLKFKAGKLPSRAAARRKVPEGVLLVRSAYLKSFLALSPRKFCLHLISESSVQGGRLRAGLSWAQAYKTGLPARASRIFSVLAANSLRHIYQAISDQDPVQQKGLRVF